MTGDKKKKVEHLGDVLKNVISDIGKKKRFSEELEEAWKDAAGKKAAPHTRTVSLRKARLVVNVDGSPWLYELTLKKRELAKKTEEKLKGRNIKEIRFRIGDVKKPI
jgi:predicted nucleic acid-binding Zn ribbon protein